MPNISKNIIPMFAVSPSRQWATSQFWWLDHVESSFPIASHDVNVSFCSARWKTPCYVGIHTTVAQLVEPPSQVIPRISELVYRKIYWKLLYLWQNVWFLTDFSLNHFKPILWKKCFSGNIIEGSLEVKLPTIWTDEKQSRAEGERRERLEERRSEKRKSQKKEDAVQMREKVGKSRNTVFFQWFVAPEARKVGSLKRRVRSQLARWEMKNCTPLWREAHFQVKMS